MNLDDDALLDAAAELALDQADPLGALGEALLEIATAAAESEMLDSVVAAALGSQLARCRTRKPAHHPGSPFDDHVKGRQAVTTVLVVDDDRTETPVLLDPPSLAAGNRGRRPGLGVYWLKTIDGIHQPPEPEGDKPGWLTSAELVSRRLAHGAEAA